MSADRIPTRLTVAELAARWRVTPRTLQRWHAAGIGPPRMKIGTRVLFRLADICLYEDDRTDDPADRDRADGGRA